MMLPSIKTCGSILSFLIVLLALCYRKDVKVIAPADLDTILQNLLKAEQVATLHSIPKVAVGFGSCIDVVADGLSVLDKFEAVSPDVPEHHESLSNYDEFLKTFAYFYEHGAAGERYVSNETLFKLLVDTSMQIKGAKKAPGGNAVVMASRFFERRV